MARSRMVLRLLDSIEGCGVREEIIGDLLEEIAGGRSRWWICRQVGCLCGMAVVCRVRTHTRVTPQAIALVMALVLIASTSLLPVGRVLQTWLTVYYVAGTLSLFAHMAAGAGRGLRGMFAPTSSAADALPD